MVSLLRILTFVPMVLAARLRRIERRAVDRLQAAGATTDERAILLENGGALTGFVYRRLNDARVLVRLGNDRYYLNDTAYQQFCGRRRKRAVMVVTLLVIIITVLYLRGDLS